MAFHNSLSVQKWISYAFVLAVSVPVSKFFLDGWCTPKWIGLYMSCILMLGSFIIVKSPLRGFLLHKGSVGTAVGVLALNIIYNWPLYISNHLLDWSSFLIVFLFFKNFFFKKKTEDIVMFLYKIFFVPSVLVLSIGYLQVFDVDVLSNYAKNEFPSSLLGHQNRTSEFVGLSVVIQLYHCLLYKRYRSLKIAFMSLSLSYIVLLQTRSVFLGLFFIMLIAVVKYFKENKKMFTILGIMTFFFTPLLLTMTGPYVGVETKIKNINIRLVRWVNTAHLIRENPLGLGPGNYEFGYIPYDSFYAQDPESSESLVVRSPHNGFLELAAEFGLPFLVIFLFLLYLLIKKMFKNLKGTEFFFVFSFFIYYINSSLWAFPMEVPFLFSTAPIFLSIIFKDVTGARSLINRPLLLIGSMLYCFVSLSCIFSYYLDFNKRDDYKLVKTGCNLFPSNWRLCIQKGLIETNRKEFETANKTYTDILRYMPHNFIALRHKAILLSKMGQQREACILYRQYDKLFDNNSSIHRYILNHCQSINHPSNFEG